MRMQGSHTAMMTGMLAGEASFRQLTGVYRFCTADVLLVYC